ncbi:universal stress protein [Streptomyces sp. NPDC051320]|uniref:universal stress protein n=1 Tax=Streptomyces sp. NPDC051320 TaxID=3154644 RepID=UPI0034198601
MDTTAARHHALGPVVVGTDGSDPATTAVLWAAAEAAARDKSLTLVYGTSIEQMADWVLAGPRTVLDKGRALLAEATAKVSALYPDLKVEKVLGRTTPEESLLDAAGPHETLVVGSRGHGGFTALLLGSVGLRVASHARGPVVIVRETAERSRGVVVAAVRDDGDRDALQFAAQTAQHHGASLRVVSAWRFPDSVDDAGTVGRSEAEATAHTVQPIREEFPETAITEEVVRSKSVAGALVEASRTADLVVMGARRPAHRLGAPLSRVTHAVLHHAHCPVAVIPRA